MLFSSTWKIDTSTKRETCGAWNATMQKPYLFSLSSLYSTLLYSTHLWKKMHSHKMEPLFLLVA